MSNASSNDLQIKTWLRSPFSLTSQSLISLNWFEMITFYTTKNDSQYFQVLLSLVQFNDLDTFNRFGKGRNCFGIDCHVKRPIMTAFILFEFLVKDVTLAKNFMSFGSFHGMLPFIPIPRLELHMATTMLSFIDFLVNSVAILYQCSYK